MQDIANDSAGRRRHHADHLRQIRQELLARFVEQAFGGELFLALLEQRHQRADAGGLERFNDDLVFGAAGKGRQPAGGDDFQPSSGLIRIRPNMPFQITASMRAPSSFSPK